MEHKGRWRGEGRMGRGCRHRMRDQSDSDTSSESSCDRSLSQEKSLEKKGKKGEKAQIRAWLSENMADFFTKRNIHKLQQARILRFLFHRLPEPRNAHLSQLLYGIEQLESKNVTECVPYLKIIRILFREDLDFKSALAPVGIVQQKKLKRKEADRRFREQYGEASVPLKKNGLIEQDLNECLFLVDGNNIMPSHKHLRKYFKGSMRDKVEGQIRLQWYLSNCLPSQNVVLFFDEQYPIEEFIFYRDYCVPPEQLVAFNNIYTVYGEGEKADDKIFETACTMKQH